MWVFTCSIIIIIIIITVLYIALFQIIDQSASQCIITPVIGFRSNSAPECSFSTPWGAFRPVAILQARTMPTRPQYRSHPTGSPFNTWVESSNVDKVPCWRTKVPGDSGIQTRTLNVRVERSHHYTTAPPLEIDGFTHFMHTILTKVVPNNLKACLRFVWHSNN